MLLGWLPLSKVMSCCHGSDGFCLYHRQQFIDKYNYQIPKYYQLNFSSLCEENILLTHSRNEKNETINKIYYGIFKNSTSSLYLNELLLLYCPAHGLTEHHYNILVWNKLKFSEPNSTACGLVLGILEYGVYSTVL